MKQVSFPIITSVKIFASELPQHLKKCTMNEKCKDV